MIEDAYVEAAKLGLALWTEDEAAPYQTAPYPGQSWYEGNQPVRLPHEYVRQGTAKLLTLFEPASGQLRVKGVTSTKNAVLHLWMKEQLAAILETLPPAPPVADEAADLLLWQRWQRDLRWPLGLGEKMPALRMLLGLDNLAGHLSYDLVRWFFDHGIMPLYTPIGGSWLNMAESVQRILKRRALDCQHPQSPVQIIELLEGTAEGWNREPTPFEWGGRRAERRRRERLRRQRLGGSGACAIRLPRQCAPLARQWQQSCHLTHWFHTKCGRTSRPGQDQSHSLRHAILDSQSVKRGYAPVKFLWRVERTFAWLGQCRLLSKEDHQKRRSVALVRHDATAHPTLRGSTQQVQSAEKLQNRDKITLLMTAQSIFTALARSRGSG